MLEAVGVGFGRTLGVFDGLPVVGRVVGFGHVGRGFAWNDPPGFGVTFGRVRPAVGLGVLAWPDREAVGREDRYWPRDEATAVEAVRRPPAPWRYGAAGDWPARQIATSRAIAISAVGWVRCGRNIWFLLGHRRSGAWVVATRAGRKRLKLTLIYTHVVAILRGDRKEPRNRPGRDAATALVEWPPRKHMPPTFTKEKEP